MRIRERSALSRRQRSTSYSYDSPLAKVSLFTTSCTAIGKDSRHVGHRYGRNHYRRGQITKVHIDRGKEEASTLNRQSWLLLWIIETMQTSASGGHSRPMKTAASRQTLTFANPDFSPNFPLVLTSSTSSPSPSCIDRAIHSHLLRHLHLA